MYIYNILNGDARKIETFVLLSVIILNVKCVKLANIFILLVRHFKVLVTKLRN